jgi:RHS repeat-associated protein
VPTVSYTRGLDLSGTLEGAGGIGGLLARSRHATTSPYGISGTSYYHADGNGNVTYLASGSGGPDGAYRYDPFGRWLAQTGSYAGANGMRFSSKPWLAHNGSNTEGLYSYGYRFYDPQTHRWLNRDPINKPDFQLLTGKREPFNFAEENNLYRFALNDPVNKYDPDGRVVPPVPVVIIIAGSVAIDFGVRIYCVCAYKKGQEAYIRTPTAILAHFSAAITATIQTYCDGPGTVRLHLWKDQNGDCHDELVVICTGKKGGE